MKTLIAENAQSVRDILHSIQGTTIRFYPEFEVCQVCGTKLQVYKTTIPRSVVSLQYGSIAAQEVLLCCPKRCVWTHDDRPIRIYRSQQLAQLVAPRQRYGFDVLAKVGTLRYLECRQRQEIQKIMEKDYDLHIPDGTIQELIVRFADTMASLHGHHMGRLRQMLETSGGYILHVDGTCEEGSQIHFACLIEPGPIVLWSAKIASENALAIREILQEVETRFGRPMATMADLSGSIHKAVLNQWPAIPFFYCHWHFLADVGRDLLTESYQRLRNILRKREIRTKLHQFAKKVDRALGDQKDQARWICQHLETPGIWKMQGRCLKAAAIAAGMTEWILSASAEGNGRGFPFDLPHLSLYHRVKRARDILEKDILGHLTGRTPPGEKFLMGLYGILDSFLQSRKLLQAVRQVQTADALFTRLREALRLAAQDSTKGLQGTPRFLNPEQARQAEADIRCYRQDLCRERKKQIPTQKSKGIELILQHLDKYWDGLFGHCLELGEPDHRYLMVQRTNNMSERFFRSVKRFLRRITGKKKLNREVNALTGQAFLIFNLKVPDYVKLICDSLENLPQAFAELSLNGEFPKHARLPSPRILDRKSRCSRDFPCRVKAVFPSRQLQLAAGL
ncbi:hypothetical protein ACFL6U_32405 [Planctomycetota bacterium]